LGKANLGGAKIADKQIINHKELDCVGNSRRQLRCFMLDDNSFYFMAGCFKGTEKELKELLDNTTNTGKLEEVWPTVVQYYPPDLKRKIQEANVPKPKKEKVKREEVKPSESLEHSLIL